MLYLRISLVSDERPKQDGKSFSNRTLDFVEFPIVNHTWDTLGEVALNRLAQLIARNQGLLRSRQFVIIPPEE